jgi:hypothetical protein
MQLTSDSTRVLVANSDDEDEDDPSGTFIEIHGSSGGSHGYRDRDGKWVDEIPAGNPFRSSVSWDFEPSNFPRVGSEFSVWMGTEGGSYHERWNKMYATVEKDMLSLPKDAYSRNRSLPKLIGSFEFSGIEDCCKKIIELTGCRPPAAYELGEVIPPKQEPPMVIKPSQADKPRPGETSEQYWKRISLEKRGKFYYPGEGGIEQEF